MRSATGWRAFLLVTLWFTVASAYYGNDSSSTWFEEEPSCPHGDLSSHVCATLDGHTFTCVTVACCDFFEEGADGLAEGEYSSESEDEEDGSVLYNDSDEDEEDESNVLYNEIESDEDECPSGRICYTTKSCTRYRCYQHCCDGFAADEDGQCQQHISGIACANRGRAVNGSDGAWTCECREGFQGDRCQIPVCDCENGGDCILKTGKPFCNCSREFSGDKCETASCEPACSNGGECVRDGHGGPQYCRCPTDFVGTQCELAFTSSAYCPEAEYSDTVGEFCYTDSECEVDRVCCKEGLSTVCRDKIVDHCTYDGQAYDIGETFTTDPCQVCTCMPTGIVDCADVVCRLPNCDNPTTATGDCCAACSGETSTSPYYSPPPRVQCPTSVVPLRTDPYADTVDISLENVDVKTDDQTVQVRFRPQRVMHCYCKDSTKKLTTITAIATDQDGNSASCTFQIVVRDTESPKYISCPEDMHIYEDELPHWSTPKYEDNVGIVRKTSPKVQEHRAVGEYTTKYSVFDYDGNGAACEFKITVSARDSSVEVLPQETPTAVHSGYTTSRIIISMLACLIGVLLLIILGRFLLFVKRRHPFYLRRRLRNSVTSNNNSRTAAYETNIHVMSCHDHMKRLGYSSNTEVKPPVFGGSVRYVNDVNEHVDMEPPTYANAMMEQEVEGATAAAVSMPPARIELPLAEDIKRPIDEASTVSAKP